MTRLRDDRVERLALEHGRLHVNTPYANGSVEVTAPSGACWLVDLQGGITVRPFNHSINWSQEKKS